MTSQAPRLVFRVIDLARHADQCVDFQADAFTVSFGDADRLHGEDGQGGKRYLEWLREAIQDFPGGHVHAWLGDEIVGQIDMCPLEEVPGVGHVYLYYVTPSWRGRGIAPRLDAHAVAWLREQGCRTARLHVGTTNARAIRFYVRHGWRDAGPRPNRPDERVMVRDL